ncbi:MAG: HesA/MoeB/ThiF family protein [Oscillospiraceae bacterium]|nr:HesA/MoeB/ThiF family protein [Oscillospiraceae bacterium]
MDLRHSRNIPALTETEQHILAGKTVAVIGCGGLGGHLIELLARVGVGSIRCVDGDVFEESNLNRQLLSTMETLGCSKAKAAAKRVKAIDPAVQVTAHPVFLTRDNARELLTGCDAVLDALDSIDARRILSDACAALGIPLVYGAISGWVAQAGVSMPGDHLIETLFPEGIELKDKSVLSFTPALCAAMQASLCVRLLAGRPVKTGSISCFDLLNQEFETIDLV